jgi:XTP/dITP diphosphohydrolase
MKQTFIVASKNKNKLNEIISILDDMPFNVISMEDAGFCDDIVENGSTFEENSIIKAQAIFSKVGGIVMADDSGLEIDFLGGAPGIFSARYAGEGATDTDRINKVLTLMNGVSKEDRTARFVCSICVIIDNNTHFTVRGTCEGLILNQPVGANGFGYDPIFFIPEYNVSMAELTSSQKNKISHRAVALDKMKKKFKNFNL